MAFLVQVDQASGDQSGMPTSRCTSRSRTRGQPGHHCGPSSTGPGRGGPPGDHAAVQGGDRVYQRHPHAPGHLITAPSARPGGRQYEYVRHLAIRRDPTTGSARPARPGGTPWRRSSPPGGWPAKAGRPWSPAWPPTGRGKAATGGTARQHRSTCWPRSGPSWSTWWAAPGRDRRARGGRPLSSARRQ